jgi:hypothetical protein
MERVRRVALRAYGLLGWTLFALVSVGSLAVTLFVLSMLPGLIWHVWTSTWLVTLCIAAVPVLLLVLVGKLVMAQQDARDAVRAVRER